MDGANQGGRQFLQTATGYLGSCTPEPAGPGSSSGLDTNETRLLPLEGDDIESSRPANDFEKFRLGPFEVSICHADIIRSVWWYHYF